DRRLGRRDRAQSRDPAQALVLDTRVGARVLDAPFRSRCRAQPAEHGDLGKILHDQGAAGRVHRRDAYLSENSPSDARLGLPGVCGFGPPAARGRTKSGLEPGERFAGSPESSTTTRKVPPVRWVDGFAPYRQKSLLFIVRIADGEKPRSIRLSVNA